MKVRYVLMSKFDPAELNAPMAPVRCMTGTFGYQFPIGCRLIVREWCKF